MPKKAIVNVGDRYNRYVIVEEVPKRNGVRYFKCKCDCGNIKEVQYKSLSNGSTKSCGCLSRDKTHLKIHGKWNTRLYRIWAGIKQRCLNPKSNIYHNYGGKGVTICEEWLEAKEFIDWAIKNGYEDYLTIDRIDVNGNYEPSNCRWITNKEQQQNKTTSHLVTYKYETLTISQWSQRTGILSETIRRRLAYGWDVERALTTLTGFEKGDKNNA